ncbi:MAG TPA: hypothetical protein VK699_10210 [Terriglobales bacterium]|jgi:hypothetical protein|nr:hypothetical protein [Terriglobales bacterium]
MIENSNFLSTVCANMRNYGLTVSDRVTLPSGPVVDYFGSRTYFSWKGFVILSQHVAVRDYADMRATPMDAEALFEASFRQAKKVNRVPLLRGMQFGFMVIPCLIVANADQALVEYAERRPPKHFSLFQFPVVVDRSTGKTHYYKQTALWGAFFFSDMREVVERCIVAAESPSSAQDAASPRHL